MRKSIKLAAMAAALGALACSCIQEKTLEGELENLGRVSFVLESAETRADAAPIANYTYRMGMDDEGVTYMLDEVVTEMEGIGYDEPEAEEGPATRGTPVYKENVLSVYGGSFTGVVYGASGQVAGEGTFDETYGIWRRDFGTDPWSIADPLTFFLRMPVSPTGVSGYSYDVTNQKMSFNYTSPTTAKNQQDILFAIRQLSRSQYSTEAKGAKGGASVLFRHALTGVKFAIGNNASQNGVTTYIKTVKFTGLKNSGTAVFSPDNSVESSVDDPDTFSSGNSFEWTLNETTGTFTQTYSESNIKTYEKNDQVGAADSFYAAGNENNLNDAKATMTFWFIPQAMTDNVNVSVTFYVKVDGVKGQEITLTLDLGSRILAQEEDLNKVWRAGQLRTFTLRPTTVDVDVEDEVVNGVKKNLSLRNTGNKPAWMRVAIVGNWVDGNGKIVAPWTQAQGTWAGGGLGGSTKWAKGADGFWYFKDPVPAGGTPSVNLFDTYTKPSTIPSGATKLIMDIAVQVIDVNAGATYTEAWASVEDSGD